MPKQSLFQERVLKVVRAIPKGKVLSYGEVAKRAGNPRAARAVGTYMKTNYRANVPCHRVVRSDGQLGGYNRGGLRAKKQKLQSEGVIIENNRVLL